MKQLDYFTLDYSTRYDVFLHVVFCLVRYRCLLRYGVTGFAREGELITMACQILLEYLTPVRFY